MTYTDRPFATPLPETTKHHREFVLGVDLGEAHDRTAIILLERGGEWGETIHVRGLRRLPEGIPYPQQAAQLAAMILQPVDLHPRVTMAVDATGVGRAVVEMLEPIVTCSLVPITITAGNNPTMDERGWWRVPKRELIAHAQVALETRILDFAANLTDLDTLTKELAAYRVKPLPGGGESYGNSARDAPHDDIVLALAVAVWQAYRNGWGRPYPLTNGRAVHRWQQAEDLAADPSSHLEAWATEAPVPQSRPSRRPSQLRDPLGGWWTR